MSIHNISKSIHEWKYKASHNTLRTGYLKNQESMGMEGNPQSVGLESWKKAMEQNDIC